MSAVCYINLAAKWSILFKDFLFLELEKKPWINRVYRLHWNVKSDTKVILFRLTPPTFK